ncbi:MAG: GerAB/ArcD/ProY family transporter [Bacillota bacterium]
MKHYTFRQMFLILAFLFPLSRMILYPSALAFASGVSGIISVFICLGCELISLVFIIIMWRKTELSFFELIEKTLSKPVAVIVACLYVLLFFIKLILILSSQKLMMYNVLYENVDGYFLFLPVLLVLAYAGAKNSNSLARLFEISAFGVAISFVGIMLLSAPTVNVANFFPILGGDVFGGVYLSSIYFGDFTFFLMFFSKTRKDTCEYKMLFAWLVNTAVTMCFIAVFFGVFGKLSVGGTYAISNLSKYTVSFSQVGRYDFLFILIVGFGFVVLALAILHALLSAGEYICGKRWLWSIIISAILFVTVYFTSENFEVFTNFAVRILPPFAFIMQFVLPIIGGIIAIFKGGKNEKQNTPI